MLMDIYVQSNIYSEKPKQYPYHLRILRQISSIMFNHECTTLTCVLAYTIYLPTVICGLFTVLLGLDQNTQQNMQVLVKVAFKVRYTS